MSDVVTRADVVLGDEDLTRAIERLRGPAYQQLHALRVVGPASLAFELVASLQRELPELALDTAEPVDAHALGVVAATAGLRRLEILTSARFSGPIVIDSPVLAELVLCSHDRDAPIELAGALPAMTSLVLDAASIAPGTLDAVLARRWPLTRLGLFIDRAPQLVATLLAAPVWAELSAIGVPWDSVQLVGPALAALGTRELLTSPQWPAEELYNVGQALRDVGRFEDAFRCFERGIALSPDDADMWLEHGNLADALARPEDAVASWKRGLDIEPEHVGCLYNLAVHERDHGDLALALTLCTQLCELAPDDPSHWHVQGQVEAELGKSATGSLHRARQGYQAAAPDDVRDAEARFQIACVHLLLGDRAACLTGLADAIQLDPTYKELASEDRDLRSLAADADFLRLITRA